MADDIRSETQQWRTEHDSMGEVQVPADGQVPRADPAGGRELPDQRAAPRARAHRGAGPDQGGRRQGQRRARRARRRRWREAIQDAAAEVARAGGGTTTSRSTSSRPAPARSSNMNTNEVLATLATEKLGAPVHPNDHVNASQSQQRRLPEQHPHRRDQRRRPRPRPRARAPRRVARAQARRVGDGRQVRPHAPHGRDAGHPRAGVRRLRRAGPVRRRAAAGRRCPASPSCRWAARRSAPASTRRPASPRAVIAEVATATGLPLTEARDHFEAQGARDALVETSGQLRTIAVGLYKIGNDLRWMGSGPRAGLGEIAPARPAARVSSIMPGKVNPVIPEALMHGVRAGDRQRCGDRVRRRRRQLRAQRDAAAARPQPARVDPAAGQHQPTAGRPDASTGSVADEERCRELAESSPSIVTPLNKYIGYEAAAKVAKQSLKERKTIRQVVLEGGYVDRGDADRGSSSTRRSTCCR